MSIFVRKQVKGKKINKKTSIQNGPRTIKKWRVCKTGGQKMSVACWGKKKQLMQMMFSNNGIKAALEGERGRERERTKWR